MSDAPRGRLHRHPGDAWVECTCGHRHWGTFGAAGLLLLDRLPPDADARVALQHRAEWSDQGGTWGVPGGAIAPDETPEQGALREAREEAGIDPATVEVLGEHVLDHGVWRYTTVVGRVRDGAVVTPEATDPESLEVRWVRLGGADGSPVLEGLRLLPAFAASLPAVLAVAAQDVSGAGA